MMRSYVETANLWALLSHHVRLVLTPLQALLKRRRSAASLEEVSNSVTNKTERRRPGWRN
jgi:hypothetical protein